MHQESTSGSRGLNGKNLPGNLNSFWGQKKLAQMFILCFYALSLSRSKLYNVKSSSLKGKYFFLKFEFIDQAYPTGQKDP